MESVRDWPRCSSPRSATSSAFPPPGTCAHGRGSPRATASPPPLTGHTGAVQAVTAFTTPDGRPLLASGDDETLRVWDPATGRQTLPPLQGHTDWIGELTAFRDPDGRWVLASCSDDETIRLWGPVTGRQTSPSLYGHGHRRLIGALTAFTGPDGRPLLASGSNDRTVRIWDPAAWTERLVISVDLVVHGLAAAGPNLALATDRGVAVIRPHF